jgi:hypothetical protein
MKRNYFILAFGLIAYGFKRYNGYDLDSYFHLAEAAWAGQPLYGEKALSLYPPAGAYVLELFHYLPNKVTHTAWYLISILIFYRISRIGFSFFQFAEDSNFKKGLFYWLSWIAILQGLGAQLEGGNINLLLMYSLFEGLNILVRKSENPRDLILGLLLTWLPVIFKPYLGLVSSGLTVFFLRRSGWRVLVAPIMVAALMTLFPALIKGFETVQLDYANWLSGDLSYIDCAFTLKCNAVNYGLPSYLYQIQNWSLANISVFVLLVSSGVLVYSFFERHLLRLAGVISIITFCVSPASFPYTLMLLWISIISASSVVVFGDRSQNQVAQICAWIFLGAMIFLNPTYVGRSFFNEVIVYYRVTTFFILLGLGTLGTGPFTKDFKPAVFLRSQKTRDP